MKKSINYKGAEVFYTVKGKGEPVLLLHGFGENSSIWAGLADGLSDYLLILPDLPGSGSSSELNQQKVAMSDYASCMAAILQEEKIDDVHFIGHSMGGYVAMEFANIYPDKLKSLCLFHSSAFADDEEKIATRRKSIEFINSHGSAAFLRTSIPALFQDADLHKDAIAGLVEAGGSFLPKTLVQYYEAMITRNDHAGLLSILNFPVLFMIGEHDKAVPLDISLKQCYLPAISFVHILRNSAHMGMCEEADRVILKVNEFLKEVTSV